MSIETNFMRKNGEFINWNDAWDHNLTHSLHYGTGAFEGIRFYPTDEGPKIFRLKEHIDRLYYSASVLGIEIPFFQSNIEQACKQLVEKNGVEAGYIRPIVYFGYGKVGLNPFGAKIETTISVWNFGSYLASSNMHVKISKYSRIDHSTSDMNAKITGNYANSILASNDVLNQGYDEALLLDTSGNIAEGPGENIFFVKGNKVITPKLGTILPGITRDTIVNILKDYYDISVKEQNIGVDNLGDFDEAFFTGTAAEVTPIDSITTFDGKRYDLTSITKEESISNKVLEIYKNIVYGKVDNYKNRLY